MPIITNNENGAFTHVIRMGYEEIRRIGADNPVTIATIPNGGAIELIGIITSKPFQQAGSINASIYVDGTPSVIALQGEDTNSSWNNSELFFEIVIDSNDEEVEVYNAQPKVGLSNVTLQFTNSSVNVANITQGEIIIALRILDPLKYAK